MNNILQEGVYFFGQAWTALGICGCVAQFYIKTVVRQIQFLHKQHHNDPDIKFVNYNFFI